MSATILDGKALAAEIRENLKQEVSQLKEKGRAPGLAVVIVGDDPASRRYVNNKKKACEHIGITSYEYALSADSTQEELLKLVQTLNQDDQIDGILVQLPLPAQIDEKTVIYHIDPNKDVDAFHP